MYNSNRVDNGKGLFTTVYLLWLDESEEGKESKEIEQSNLQQNHLPKMTSGALLARLMIVKNPHSW